MNRLRTSGSRHHKPRNVAVPRRSIRCHSHQDRPLTVLGKPHQTGEKLSQATALHRGSLHLRRHSVLTIQGGVPDCGLRTADCIFVALLLVNVCWVSGCAELRRRPGTQRRRGCGRSFFDDSRGCTRLRTADFGLRIFSGQDDGGAMMNAE